MNKFINIVKKFPIICGIILTVVFDKITDIPLQNIFTGFMSYQSAFLLHISILQISCGLLSILILKNLKLKYCYNLFSKISINKKSYSFFFASTFTLLIIIINLMSISYETVFSTSAINLILYFIGFMSTGFYEELVSRALVFNMINNKYGQTRKGFFFSVFVTNIIFGSTHFIWYLMGLYPLSTSLNQIMYAFMIGVFFSALYLKYDSLLIPMIFHGLIDVAGCTDFLEITSKELFNISLAHNPVDIASIIVTFFIFLPFLIIGIMILRKLGPKNKTAVEVVHQM